MKDYYCCNKCTLVKWVCSELEEKAELNLALNLDLYSLY